MTDASIFDKLFIFEMANNHMGDVEHGIRVIREHHDVVQGFDFRFAFKFQYRHLDTFIHPAFRDRTDIKYVKRFSETRLDVAQLRALKDEISRLGFIAICTPFDEKSVDLIEEYGFDIIKIASCSFNDWPLLERIAQTDKPVIASTAGASMEDIDKIVAFWEHRQRDLCLMHCVGSYPTPSNQLELNQIDFLRNRYVGIPVGYSTHEDPADTDAVKIAIGKGAAVLERHVGVGTDEYSLNAYSSTPEQIRTWLASARTAFEMCGVSGRRRDISEKEKSDLRGLQRGIFAATRLDDGEEIGKNKVFYAIPNFPGQYVANDRSKYRRFRATAPIDEGEAILETNASSTDSREKIVAMVKDLKDLIMQSGVRLPNRLDFELSHHYGIDKFYQKGCAIVNCINREYCKKIILLLAGQENPVHYHRRKEETFNVLFGEVEIDLQGNRRTYREGEFIVVERGIKHSFRSDTGAVFEEVSTTHYTDDSFYEDEAITKNSHRKTLMTFWIDWMEKPIK